MNSLAQLDSPQQVIFALGPALSRAAASGSIPRSVAQAALAMFPGAEFVSVQVALPQPGLLLSVESLLAEGDCTVELVTPSSLAGKAYAARSPLSANHPRMSGLPDVDRAWRVWRTPYVLSVPLFPDQQLRILECCLRLDVLPVHEQVAEAPAVVQQYAELAASSGPCVGTLTIGTRDKHLFCDGNLTNLCLVSCIVALHLGADMLELLSSPQTAKLLTEHAAAEEEAQEGHSTEPGATPSSPSRVSCDADSADGEACAAGSDPGSPCSIATSSLDTCSWGGVSSSGAPQEQEEEPASASSALPDASPADAAYCDSQTPCSDAAASCSDAPASCSDALASCSDAPASCSDAPASCSGKQRSIGGSSISSKGASATDLQAAGEEAGMAAGEEEEIDCSQHQWLMHFRHPRVEREYVQWLADSYIMMQRLVNLIMGAPWMLLAGLTDPWMLRVHAPGVWFVMATFIFVYSYILWMRPDFFKRHFHAVVTASFAFTAWFFPLAAGHIPISTLPPETLRTLPWLPFSVGCLTNVVVPLCYMPRFKWFVPYQLVSIAANVKHMAALGARLGGGPWLWALMIMWVLGSSVGFAGLLTYCIDARSRKIFLHCRAMRRSRDIGHGGGGGLHGPTAASAASALQGKAGGEAASSAASAVAHRALPPA